MYVSKEQYEAVTNQFLNDRHGSIVKLVDLNGKIFGYLMRCETSNKKNICFSIGLVDGYPNIKNIKYIKYCMMLRTLTKWSKSKTIYSFKNDFKNAKETFEKNLENEINTLSDFLKQLNYDVNNTELYKYILKNITNIEKYYKTDDFNLILI